MMNFHFLSDEWGKKGEKRRKAKEKVENPSDNGKGFLQFSLAYKEMDVNVIN